jgi:hypothetical protein
MITHERHARLHRAVLTPLSFGHRADIIPTALKTDLRSPSWPSPDLIGGSTGLSARTNEATETQSFRRLV